MQTATVHARQPTIRSIHSFGTNSSTKSSKYFPSEDSIYLARDSLLISSNQEHRILTMPRSSSTATSTKQTRTRPPNKYRLPRSQSWNKPHVVLLSTSQSGDFYLIYDHHDINNTSFNSSFIGDHRYIKNPILNRIPTQITSLKRRVRKVQNQRMIRDPNPTLVFQPHPSVRSSSIENNPSFIYSSPSASRSRTHSLEKSTRCVPLPPVTHPQRSNSMHVHRTMTNVCEC